MKTFLILFGCMIFLSRGLMAEHHPLPQQWVTVKGDQGSFQVDFPYHPLEMTFDIPFQNTPPEGKIHLYSVPTQAGLLVLGTLNSPTIHAKALKKEEFHQLFESIFVPHFFYNPAIFQDHQTFEFHSSTFKEEEAASFQFSFEDHGIMKKVEGMAFIKNQVLYIPFYLSSKKDFNRDMFDQFLQSIHFL